MCRSGFWAIGAVLVLSLLLRPTTMSGDSVQDSDDAELTKLAIEAGHAYAARDLAALERLTADDYEQIDVRGGVLNKVQWLDFVKNRRSDLTVESEDIRIHHYGQTAVVTGKWTYTKKDDGTVRYSRWTSIWVRSADGWKRHAFQNTYINSDADHCGVVPGH